MSDSPFPFLIGAPSMVYGFDLMDNVRRLASRVDVVEILLYSTPTEHNFPSRGVLRELGRIAGDEGLTYTVHLPASLEPAAEDSRRRSESMDQIRMLCEELAVVSPRHFVLHLPFTPPILAPVPGQYFSDNNGSRWADWYRRARAALRTIGGWFGADGRILIENINYSPDFFIPLINGSPFGICLDVGHLLLGRECVRRVFRRYLSQTGEIHLHGVRGFEEHISLRALPASRLVPWVRDLLALPFTGLVTLEVFSPADLQGSLAYLAESLDAARHLESDPQRA